MENLCFYPTLTDEMWHESGIFVGDYEFKYIYNNEKYNLTQEGSTTIRLTDDPLYLWNVESDGLIIYKTVRITDLDVLKGPNGIACRGATLGICLMWSDAKLTQKGHILPTQELTEDGYCYDFNYTFKPRTLSGGLKLKLIMYIEKPADNVLPDESNLINEAGVIVGELETKCIDFGSLYMEFPILEYKTDKGPLWWIEFSEWTDPEQTDLFNTENIRLYINPNYKECPSLTENGIKNFDMLVEILSQAFFLMFRNLKPEQLLKVMSGVDLAPNTICSVLHQFYEDCEDLSLGLEDEIPNEMLLKELQINISRMLQGD